tara:strand:- start:55 stop:576 length:522 start_codon:yes stop_codon:yes gene_type:complete
MTKTRIIDNFLNKSYHQEILNLLEGPNFPWYYQANITSNNKIKSFYNCGFNHILIDLNGPRLSNFYYLILPFLLKIKDTLKVNKILRCRGDMTLNSSTRYTHEYHTDFPYKNIATIYYVNESDGDTIIKNSKEEKISPKSNRLIIFDGSVLHAGSSPKHHKNRILINSNFEKL